MTIGRFRASTFAAPDFAATGSAVDPGDGTYATWTDSSRRGSTVGTFGGFDFSILAGATINSIALEVRDLVDTPGDFNNVTETSTGGSWSPSSGATVQQLALPSLPSSVELTFLRGNNTRSTTYSIDWCDVVVDYEAFQGSELLAWLGAWTPGKLKRYDGASWQPATVQRYNGATWEAVP